MRINTPKTLFFFIGLGICFGLTTGCKSKEKPAGSINPSDTNASQGATKVSYWVTMPDKSELLKKQEQILFFKTDSNRFPTIRIDTATTYQEMDGFGFSLTGGSAYLINKLAAADRETLLKELFGSDASSIGISYLRISIGASDLNASVFSYNDLPKGQTDPELKKFSLAPDKTDLIPVLKSILLINPKIKIMGSPWSAPVWMKSNGKSIGGSLQPNYYPVYAKYLVRYLTEMKNEGIPIDAITIQNEPLNPDNNPSMKMLATEQRDFIKNHLGPAFKAAGLSTKIVLYDHNCDHPEYATTILADPAASQYIDGSAFHLYGGEISTLSKVHDAFPTKNVYFTEQWVGGPSDFGRDLQWHVQNLIIGASRNWSKNVLEWNLASDPSYKPHTNGGCTQCEGALTIGTYVVRNVSYYIIAHASKFVPAGSVRIGSDSSPYLPNVAFRTPEGKTVLIVFNPGTSPQTFNIKLNGKIATTTLSNGAVATYVW